MNIQGIISNKEMSAGIGKTGKPYTRCVYTILDKNYSTFDKKIIDNFNIGALVNIKLEQKGEYMNLVSMENVEASEAVPVVKVAEPVVAKPKEFHLSVEECRARALEAALTYYKMHKITKTDNEALFAMADEMLVYIKG